LLTFVLAFGPEGSAPVARDIADGAWQLLYVGAEDCAPCRSWRAAHWDAVRAAHPPNRVRFVELRARRSAEVLDDALWAESLRPHRDAIPREAGLPYWVLSRGADEALDAWGLRGWDGIMAPALRRVGRRLTVATRHSRTLVEGED
jgi:hypothetical protein